ncbi:hypothetical protein LINGRAPRIM_LOCUS3011 [Linum grandiflorum]
MADSRSELLTDLRCHHCAGPLTKQAETSSWTNRPLLRDSFSMIGTAVGGTASTFYGFNHVMPVVQRYVKGPMWVHFFIGVSPFIFDTRSSFDLSGVSVLNRAAIPNYSI